MKAMEEEVGGDRIKGAQERDTEPTGSGRSKLIAHSPPHRQELVWPGARGESDTCGMLRGKCSTTADTEDEAYAQE